MRQKAIETLLEFKDIIERYNYLAKRKITDIFPNNNESPRLPNRKQSKDNGFTHASKDAVVNITVLEQ